VNKNERIKAVLKGKKVNKIPFSFWTHLPKIDLDPKLLAEKTYEFYSKYNIDFIKSMPNGMYSVEDFGCRCDYSEIKSGGVGKIISSPVNKLEDWVKIKPVNINEGALGRELLSLRLLLKKVNGDAPVVVTVFSPVTTAAKLSNNKLYNHIKGENTELVHKALDIIAEITSKFIEKAIELGASGVFFAAQSSSYNFLNEDQYKKYGVPYDIKALRGSLKGWFNILHIHGNNIMFDLLKDYPVEAINWHIWEAGPTITEARKITDKCLIGGIVRTDITENNREAVSSQIKNSYEQSNGYKHIITPGCVVRYPINGEMLNFIKEEIEKVGKTASNHL